MKLYTKQMGTMRPIKYDVSYFYLFLLEIFWLLSAVVCRTWTNEIYCLFPKYGSVFLSAEMFRFINKQNNSKLKISRLLLVEKITTTKKVWKKTFRFTFAQYNFWWKCIKLSFDNKYYYVKSLIQFVSLVND